MKDKALKLALEKINKASEKVAALCDGRERWTMSVPVRPDYDHDVVISGALSAAEDAIKQALAQPEQKPDRSGMTYYRNDKCKALNSANHDCICWTAAQPAQDDGKAASKAMYLLKAHEAELKELNK